MDVINAMSADINDEIGVIKVDGGASASELIMQFQSDITNKKLIRPVIAETTALGGSSRRTCSRLWKNRDELKNSWVLEKTYTPKMDRAEAQKLIKGWEKAVRCTKMFSED